MGILSNLAQAARRWQRPRPLTDQARAAIERDRRGLPEHDPGPEAVIREGYHWLCRAQDLSASRDGGVARDFSLLSGWATSYPETTGYIVPTMLDYGKRFHVADAIERSRRMLDWCVSIQLPGGGFQGGRIDAKPVVPVTFNTGQILIGLSAGVAHFGDVYKPAAIAAADWLAESLDPDGCWRRYPTPFASNGEKAYETHVAWGLFEAERIAPGHGYGAAGLRNVHWALTKQESNGWFADNCLSDPKRPLTHTIGYVLRGVLEAHRLFDSAELLAAARRTADGLIPAIDANGYLAGCLDQEWRPAADYACLTGSVQIAHCLMMLHQLTGATPYREKAVALNTYVRRTIDVSGDPDTRGAVKGSFPVDGDYGTFQYLNWAAKFMIDANLLELDLRASNRAAEAKRA